MKNKHRPGSLLMMLGTALIIGAVILAGYNLWSGYQAEKAAADVLEQIELPPAVIPELGLIEVEYPDYILNPDMEMPTTEIDGYEYIGVLDIPHLELSLPIMSDWTYPQLQIAPCRYVGTAYKGDMVLCGHNFQSHFGRLNELSIGDTVTFTDVDGNVFDYTVVEVELLGSTAIEEMETGDWNLTLFTCTYGGRTRYTVRCSLDGDDVIIWDGAEKDEGKG